MGNSPARTAWRCGAVRHNQPNIVVFVGTDGGAKNCFQRWGSDSEPLPHMLNAHAKYPLVYHTALAAARPWEFVEPPGAGVFPQPQPTWVQRGLVTRHSWMAFDANTVSPNPFFAEQLLVSELGEEVERQDQPRTISLVRLEDLFRPVLHKAHIDESWPSERQFDAFLEYEAPYVAVTQNGRFKLLISRNSVLNTMAGNLVRKEGESVI